ncbi:hypothetical protein V6N11_001859 [Hibiscus sabdariffa]|uniref:Uncharacterized protein n=1 Tax=Hibiscus sabdariffa TaxID=183260 RepID=A0ABR2QTQ2_9ROSI
MQSNNLSIQQRKVDDQANKDVEPLVSNYPHVEIEPPVEIENENENDAGHRTSPVISNNFKVRSPSWILNLMMLRHQI